MNENSNIEENENSVEMVMDTSTNTSGDMGREDGESTVERNAQYDKLTELIEAQRREIGELKNTLNTYFQESSHVDNRTDFEKYLDSAESMTYRLLKRYGKIKEELK